jgi:hypothetical protein
MAEPRLKISWWGIYSMGGPESPGHTDQRAVTVIYEHSGGLDYSAGGERSCRATRIGGLNLLKLCLF